MCAMQKGGRGSNMALQLPSNDYVWTLRAEVAGRLGVAVNRVRMIAGVSHLWSSSPNASARV